MPSKLLCDWMVPFSLLDESDLFIKTIGTTQDFSMYETEHNVVVEAHVPGIPAEDCEITYEKGTLTIRAHKKETEEDKDRKYLKRADQNFVYKLSIPGMLDETKEPKASYKDGVLKVIFTKQKKVEPVRIEIHRQ